MSVATERYKMRSAEILHEVMGLIGEHDNPSTLRKLAAILRAYAVFAEDCAAIEEAKK